MRKPLVVLFYSHQQDKQFCESLEPELSTIAFPLDQELKADNLIWKPSIVIIWDSSKEGRGIARLKEVTAAFPQAPLFLVVKDPSREYLMAALHAKVSNFFTLPLDQAKLRRSVFQAAKGPERQFPMEKARNWFWKFRQLAQSFLSSFSQPASSFAASPLTDGLVAAYPAFHMPQKKLELEHCYDMSVQFFGKLNILAREKPAPRIRGKKNATVLAYLLFHHQRPTHRDILMDKFWRDYTTSSARNSLNVAICCLRKNLSKTFKGQEIIVYDSQSYGINPDLKIITDTEKFIHYWKKGSAIESSQGIANALGAYNTAISHYKEEFLSDIRFDNWCEYERDNLKEIYLFILNRLGIHFFGQQQYEACINTCRKMLKEDSCLEEVHRKLMACYYHLGLADLALKQYFKCKKALEEELNLSPSEPTAELFNRIQNGRLIQMQ